MRTSRRLRRRRRRLLYHRLRIFITYLLSNAFIPYNLKPYKFAVHQIRFCVAKRKKNKYLFPIKYSMSPSMNVVFALCTSTKIPSAKTAKSTTDIGEHESCIE